jgi:hypothetical protein
MAYEFLSAKQVADIPFIILDGPVRVYQTNLNYKDEDGPAISGMGDFQNFYLRDDSQPPYATIKVGNKEEKNLISFVDGNEISIDYNFFNYPAEVTVEGADGTQKKYRRKWLSHVYRANVMFPKPVKLMVWDKQAGAKVEKEVEFAKVDFPAGAWTKKIGEKIETLQENSDIPLRISEFEIKLSYDPKASPNEMYSAKVKANNKSLDVEALLTNFERKAPEFVPPENPFA